MLNMLKSFKNIYFSLHFRSCFALLQHLESVQSSIQKSSQSLISFPSCEGLLIPISSSRKDVIKRTKSSIHCLHLKCHRSHSSSFYQPETITGLNLGNELVNKGLRTTTQHLRYTVSSQLKALPGLRCQYNQ